MKTLLAAVLALGSFTLSAFADNTPPSPGPGNPCVARARSGIEGTVDRGPVQPVARPGQPDTAPMGNTEIVVKDEKGKEVARTKTDKNGRYEVELPAGKYTVVGPRNGIMPGNWKKDVEVKANQWLKLNIHIDSGIRTPVRPAAAKALGTHHKIDLSKPLPAKLTVKVGDSINFNGLNFASWKVTDANGVKLLQQAMITVFPPQLNATKAGTGKLEIRYRDPQLNSIQTHVIELTVQP
jgi:hypothetical protein